VTEPVLKGDDGVARCFWAGNDPLYRRYHDEEWGMPLSDDRRLFEKICLEGFQSGLSWLTILRKRENFRAAFDGFDFRTVAKFGKRQVDRLMKDAGIVRHRGKIESAINNAKRASALADEHGSLARYLWQWNDAKALAADLKKNGWTFVGPTTIYAFMQSSGMVNDHPRGCDAFARVEKARKSFRRPE
jgi:DNA-3-methyladenine glycosylase I